MSEPEIAAKIPAVLELDPGVYWYCTCGKSKTQPWCDGSHKGTEFTPVQLTLAEKKRVAICQCKRTGKEPFCDGSHAKL